MGTFRGLPVNDKVIQKQTNISEQYALFYDIFVISIFHTLNCLDWLIAGYIIIMHMSRTILLVDTYSVFGGDFPHTSHVQTYRPSCGPN